MEMVQMNNEPWFKSAVFYQVNVRAFYDSSGNGIGDLNGLTEKVPYLANLGIDCIWIMPIYSSPLNDDGYDIADFFDVHPDLGTLDDFKRMVEVAHQKGIRIIADLVINHTSDQHPWFQQARQDPQSEYRDYYVWSESDRKYQDTRIIFRDVETSNWTWDEQSGEFFWHRFYSSQPDLNFDNPAVREEMKNVAKFWLDLGIDGFRVDAVPYLFEREGTNCENLPETHDYLKELRQYIDQHYPQAVLLCEANQWPADLRPYFGDGDEFHMGFHFPLMPRVYMALESGEVTKIVEILDQTPEIPENCGWCTFLRNHDELTLEMVTEEERQWMWERYAPKQRMRLNLGIRRRLAPLLGNDTQKIRLANSLLFTLPGSPFIYYGDEIGMGDNIWLNDRDGVRTPMQWSSERNGSFSTAPKHKLFQPIIDSVEFPLAKCNVAVQIEDQESLFTSIKQMIEVRGERSALSIGRFRWAESGENPNLAAYFREDAESCILVVNNLSAQSVEAKIVEGGLRATSLFKAKREYIVENGKLAISLPHHFYDWLLISPEI